MAEPPAGTVTFLFTDIEGSTKLWERYPVAMRDALARHDHILRSAIEAHDGYVFKTIGDAFCAAFPSPRDGLNAALAAQQALVAEPWPETGPIRARMALHSGEVTMRDGDYFGPPVNRVARLLAVGHGGQILLSEATWHAAQSALPPGVSLQDMGKQRLKDIGQREHIVQVTAPGLPSVFPKLKTPPSPFPGAIAGVVLGLLALALYPVAFGYKSFSPSLFAPATLLTNLTDLVMRLAAYRDAILLAVVLVLIAITAAAILVWRHATRFRRHRGSHIVRLVGRRVSLRTVAFFAAATMLVAGAYGYQQYLWRWELPVPEGRLGLALTKEASAAAFNDELAVNLREGGSARPVVVRDLPVYFDDDDDDVARDLGERIDAKVVMMYSEDASNEFGDGRYAAYVVFTNPLSIGGFGEVGLLGPREASGGTAVPAGLELRARTKEEVFSHLVNAAAGLIAYEDGQYAVAVALLEHAQPDDLEAPNAGIVNHYLGLAYRFNDRPEEAKVAQDRAIKAFEDRLAARGRLGTQDQLILVKSYEERCVQAGWDDQWDAAIATCEKATKFRDALVATSEALFRPADVHMTYYGLYGALADAYRAKGQAEDETYWQLRAEEEGRALGLRPDAEEPYTLIFQSRARLYAGDCVGGADAINRALARNPTDPRLLVDAHNNLGSFYYFQGRYDLAERHWREAAAVKPDDVVSRENLANLLESRGLGADYLDPAVLADAEAYYREVLAIDPTNQGAHRQLADAAWWRAQTAAVIDSTAAQSADDLAVAKSQGLWDTDPERMQAATDAYGDAIQERRTIATELRPDDPVADAEVAAAYEQRIELVYSALLTYAIYGASTPDQDPDWVAETGQRVVDDVAQVRQWSSKALDDPDASRYAKLTAWRALLGATQREWSWYFFNVFGNDQAKAEQVQAEYRQAVDDAVAFVESAPIGSKEETESAQLIYLEAATFAQVVDGDQDKGADYQRKSLGVAAQGAEAPAGEVAAAEATPAVIGYAESTERLSTKCLEVREQTAGDEELAGGDPEAAQEHHRAALEVNPQHVPALLGLAKALHQADDLPGAIAQAQAATQADPNDPRAWALLGYLQFLSGDDAGAAASYDRYLAAVAPLGPQARMASLRATIGDLRGALDRDHALSPRIAPLVPRLAEALDGMTDAAGTYQYPALYAQLGGLALYADDAAAAEPLLRKAVGFGQHPDGASDCAGFVPTACDAHQPVAWADLVLAALVQGRDGKPEIEAAVRAAESPLWQRVAGFEPPQPWSMLQGEADAYARWFPDRQGVADTFAAETSAIRVRHQLAWKGVVDRTYTSPKFGYGLAWDASWSVTDAQTGFYDTLQLANGVSDVLIEGAAAYGGDAAGCVDDVVARMSADPAYAGFAPAAGRDGAAVPVREPSRASAAFTYAAEGVTYTVYLECRAAADGSFGIKLEASTPAAAYDGQRGPLERLFSAITPAVDAPGAPVPRASPATPPAATPVASPVAGAAAWSVRLPELDLASVPPDLPGVTGSAYASPGYGYRLEWNGDWTPVAASSDADRDALRLSNDTSELSVEAFAAEGGPGGCASAVRDELVNDPAVADVRIMTDAAGTPLRGQIEGGVYTVFAFTRATEGQAPTAEALYVSCRDLGDGKVLRVEQSAPASEYETQAAAREALLAGLEVAP